MISFFPSRTVAVDLFGFGIHWYGIMYLLGFLAAFVLLPNIQRDRKLYLTRDEWAAILSWAVLGVVVGGRLGYVLFYEPQYFAQHPLEIFAVWNGGMASHGGFIGVALAMSYVCWKMKIDPRKLADTVVIPVAIGLALGRFGNFINQELYGTVTTLPWGISIPGVEGLRHPTQIYEMILDLLNAMLCYLYLHFRRPVVLGRTCALFLVIYGISRFMVEYLRVQDYSLVKLGSVVLTRGQLFTIPLFLIGVFLWIALRPEREEEE